LLTCPLQLYLIHWPVAFAPGSGLFPKNAEGTEILLNKNVSIVQTWKAVTELPKSKVRSVGVSNFTIENVCVFPSSWIPKLRQLT
jgi:L-glyceraldehyde reductase